MNEQKTIEQKLLATHAYMRAVQEREKAFEADCQLLAFTIPTHLLAAALEKEGGTK